MSTIHRSRSAAFVIAAVFAAALFAPVAVNAQEDAFAAAPAGPSWDETSGYGAVETSRATIALPVAPAMAWDATSGYGAVEASRAARTAGLAPDPTWDETSGYGAVEAIRTDYQAHR